MTSYAQYGADGAGYNGGYKPFSTPQTSNYGTPYKPPMSIQPGASWGMASANRPIIPAYSNPKLRMNTPLQTRPPAQNSNDATFGIPFSATMNVNKQSSRAPAQGAPLQSRQSIPMNAGYGQGQQLTFGNGYTPYIPAYNGFASQMVSQASQFAPTQAQFASMQQAANEQKQASSVQPNVGFQTPQTSNYGPSANGGQLTNNPQLSANPYGPPIPANYYQTYQAPYMNSALAPYVGNWKPGDNPWMTNMNGPAPSTNYGLVAVDAGGGGGGWGGGGGGYGGYGGGGWGGGGGYSSGGAKTAAQYANPLMTWRF